MRILAAGFALALFAATAAAQDWDGPNPLRDAGIGVMYWEHPLGDSSTLPCAHVEPRHPEGHATRVPCAHMTPAHPDGHPGPRIPCAHLDPVHPEGDVVRAPCAHLGRDGRPAHPDGHPVRTPCAHIGRNGPEHPAGHVQRTPCVHREPEHPDGHPGPVAPCTHLTRQHPRGHAGPVTPCAHLGPAHPRGHPGPSVPCRHPLNVIRRDLDLNLVFYTNDEAVQEEAIRIGRKLREFGLEIGGSRPLHVFARDPVPAGEFPDDAVNPTWPHYNPAFHSVQVYPTSPRWREVLKHEMGHATLGNGCVQFTGGGGRHTMTGASRPGVAISEGWAHFVALAVMHDRDESDPVYSGMHWEDGTRANGDPAGRPSPRVEFRVGCMLWDLYDVGRDGADDVSLDFPALFRVFSVSLDLLDDGPGIPDLDNYLSRLIRRHRGLGSRITAVRNQNCMRRR